MSILSCFADDYIQPIYPALKRVYSKRSKALFLYSEQFNQVIYIKQTKTKIQNRDVRMLLTRGINDIERVFKQEYGRKHGMKLFNDSYKTQVIVCPKLYKPVYRHLRALNRLGKADPHIASKTFNSHNWHMIFDLSKITEEHAAGTVYKSLHKKMNHQFESINRAFKERKKTAYSTVKTNLQDLEQSSLRLLSLYYQFTGEGKKHIISKELEAEVSYQVEMLQHATPIYPEGYNPEITIEESTKEQYNYPEGYNPEITIEEPKKEPYKKDSEVQ